MGEHPIEFDTVLDLCQHPRRRIVLAVLAEEARPLTIGDLTHTIITHQYHTTISDLPHEAVRNIRVTLLQEHIPQLAAQTLVEYDGARHVVTPVNGVERAQPHLDRLLAADPGLTDRVTLGAESSSNEDGATAGLYSGRSESAAGHPTRGTSRPDLIATDSSRDE